MSGYIWVSVTVMACMVFLCSYIVLKEKKKSRNMLQRELQKLERAISGNLQEEYFDESMDAAITKRLNQLVEMAGMQRDRAQEECDATKALISDISHQIRTPLSNIMLYTDLLREQHLEGNAVQLAGKIRRQSEKLDFYMKELLKTSYAEQEMLMVKPEKVSADTLISRACQTVEMEALKKNIYISCAESGCFCCADPKWTAEALRNILENALKYSPENSTVMAEVIDYDSFICIQIKDQGMGISEEEQGLIFQRFYRSAVAAGVPGFGIGLYVAREIISRQGGYIRVKSKLGQGAVFQVFLPH